MAHYSYLEPLMYLQTHAGIMRMAHVEKNGNGNEFISLVCQEHKELMAMSDKRDYSFMDVM